MYPGNQLSNVSPALFCLQRWIREHKARGQGQGHKKILRPRPKTQDTDANVVRKKMVSKIFSRDFKKKGLQNFFSGDKRLQKFFFRQSLLEETKKKVFADFPPGFWRFSTKFQKFKNSAVLEPRTGQFSSTWGFEDKDFKMCPRGLHLWLSIYWLCCQNQTVDPNFRHTIWSKHSPILT